MIGPIYNQFLPYQNLYQFLKKKTKTENYFRLFALVFEIILGHSKNYECIHLRLNAMSGRRYITAGSAKY